MLDHRILMHSHDGYGLGHIRRSQQIARYLAARDPQLSALILAGTFNLHLLRPERGIDYVKMPCVRATYNKGKFAGYQSPTITSEYPRLFKVRQELALSITQTFEPRVFVTDIGPGVDGEAVKTLEWIKSNRPDIVTTVILTDILGPEVKMLERWRQWGNHSVFDLYDKIFACGLNNVFSYDYLYDGHKNLIDKTVYCGYLLPPVTDEVVNIREVYGLDERKLISVVLGAGLHSIGVIRFFLNIAPKLPRVQILVSVGPMMDPEEAREILAEALPITNVVVVIEMPTSHILPVLQSSDLIVTRGGYNSICEAISVQRPIIAVPIGDVDEEEAVRAQKFDELGLVVCMEEPELSFEAITRMLDRGYVPPDSATGRAVLSRSAYDYLGTAFQAWFA